VISARWDLVVEGGGLPERVRDFREGNGGGGLADVLNLGHERRNQLKDAAGVGEVAGSLVPQASRSGAFDELFWSPALRRAGAKARDKLCAGVLFWQKEFPRRKDGLCSLLSRSGAATRITPMS